MTRELPPQDEDEQPPERPAGHVRPTGPGVLVGFGSAGLVVGWMVRPLHIRFRGSTPDPVGWTPGLALLLVAAILGAVAWVTYRDVHRRAVRLEPHKAVNRLVLAKASALAGALATGGHLGYAVSWWGESESALTQQRILHSLVAAVAGVLIVAASLGLERACRVRGGDGADPNLRP